MKKIYVFILFLAFMNVMIPYMDSLGWFPYSYDYDPDHYNVDDEGMIETSEGVFEDVSGYNFGDVTSFDLDTLATIGGAIVFGIAFAIMFRSPAPIAVTLFLAIFINIWRNSQNILTQFKISPYLYGVFALGILLLIVITIIEYMTQGDVSDS